ncbi:MAG: hypothetical protein KDI36_05955 [Pseudomonadales bacterium]|nr:hypothetical protein [Pseudomonadales bacterium]
MTKIVMIGAGSLQFGAGMLGDIFQSTLLVDAEIVLNDINEKAATATLKMAQEFIAANGLKQRISVESDLAKALKGADFVLISIEVGDRFKLWDMDWKIPQQYGIQQVYGENGGPGGLFHSLRIIPPILEICRSVSEVSPDATIFNFSNPMSRICTTVHRAFPELKFIGMCHEIASLERHLAPLLGVSRDQIHYRAAGLNHFSVLADVIYTDSGESAYEDVRAKAPAYFSALPGYSEILNYTREKQRAINTEGWMEVDLSEVPVKRQWSDRWLFRDILEQFNLLPITYDSHFGEYIQWAHEVSDHRGILDFYTLYRHHLGDSKPAIKLELHERVVPIIEGMLADRKYEEGAVNIPNNGHLRNLPDWMVVEVPAYIDASGIQGINVDLPSGFTGLLTNQIGVHDMTAEAVLRKSRDCVIQALLVDPVVTVAKQIPDLVDHMIQEQSPWLDYLG